MPLESMYERVGRRADLYQQVLYLLGGGLVRRYHTVPVLKDVTTGHHQYTVAWLCYVLSDGFPSVNLLMAALAHDTAEQVGGDMPSPAKHLLHQDGQYSLLEEGLLNDNHLHFELTHEEKHVLNIADKFAGMLECVHERNMGNLYVARPYRRWKDYLLQLTLTGIELQVHAVIEQLWKEATTP